MPKLSQLPVSPAQPNDLLLALRGGQDICVPGNTVPGNVTAASMPYLPPLAGAVATTVGEKLGRYVDVFDFMSIAQKINVMLGGLTVDVAPAIQAALNSGASAVYLLPYPYKLSSGITVPAGVCLYGDGFRPSNPTSGARLEFDLSVPIGLTMGGASANNGSVTVKGFSIGRAAGAPPAGSIGLLVQNTYASIIEDIGSFSHQIPAKFLADGTNNGINCTVNRLFTGAAYDSHLVLDTIAEVRFNQCRFGMSGAGDQTCNSYVRIQGGSTTNAAFGPNTYIWNNCQFNQGQNTGSRWVAFQNQTPGALTDAEVFQFNNCYVEDDVVGLFSDSTWTNNIINLSMSNCEFNPVSSSQQFFSLNAATQINNWFITGCLIKCALTISPTPQVNVFTVSDSQFLGLVSVNVVANSVVLMDNISFGGGLTLAGNQTECRYTGCLTSGALTKSAVTAGTYPIIDLIGYNGLRSWIPTLAFGGASTGITYTVQQGLYEINGNVVTLTFSITLSSVGSATGLATISNLPVPENTLTAEDSGGGPITSATNMAGLTGGALVGNVGAGVINLYETGATGVNTLANTNFTATSTFRGTLTYMRA
jgi:hypothetical protein